MGRSLFWIILLGILAAAAYAQYEKSFMEILAEQVNANAQQCKLIKDSEKSSFLGKKLECPSYCYAQFMGFMKDELVDKDELESKLMATKMNESMAKMAAAKCGMIYAGDKCSTADALFKCLAKNTTLKEKS